MNTNGNGDNLGGLSTRAMLCGVSISMFGNRKLNKTISREAAESRGMGEKIGRYNQWLLIENEKGDEAKEYKSIVSIRNKTDAIHREMTLPWMDNGTRINSAANFFDWAAAMREQKNQFEATVNFFVQEYPNLVMRTKQIMDAAALAEGKPSMFNGRYYPSQAELNNRFAFSTSVLPLPESTDFRVKLGDHQVATIKSQIEEQLKGAVMQSTQHLFERLGEVVQKVVYLGDPKSTIQKALARDIEQITKIAAKLNIAGDSDLEAFAKRIERELSFEAVMLKTCAGEREALAARALAIQNDMAGFFSIGGEL